MLLKRMILPVTAGILLCYCSTTKKTSQQKTVSQVGAAQATIVKPDTSKKGINKPKPYKEVITAKAITDTGLFKVHKVDDRYFFEIPDSLLNREILIVNRISKGGAVERRPARGMLGFAGDIIGENQVQFVKGPNNKVFINRISYRERSNDTTENGMYRSVRNSNLQPIVASFDIKAFTPDSTGVVLDMTDYISTDNDVLFFDGGAKKMFGVTSLQADKSYIDRIQSFPMNVEIRTVKTYSTSEDPVTYELNSSLVLLPSKPMQPRYYDERVGYFARGYIDFDFNPQSVYYTAMITRWKLEPKEEDIERYKRGELVEPKKPIIYYIDPATPQKWVPYLIKGINDWQKAFEKAGFKNAIYGLEAPKNDPEWSLEDARHNAIVYKPSYVSNASGPHVHDPRSGEILESHINWYHNVMDLLHNWYMVQAGAVDSNARKVIFDDSLMGELIRFVCSHEVGHTLGLRHNFGSSSTIPVDSLRSKRWVEANGHTPSIMDYARFNYVAQPEDNISRKGIFPRIGIYDEWAIEWGYRWFPEFKTPREETVYLNKWIIEKLRKDKRLWYGSEEIMIDPRCQSEDLGDDAVKASTYGIKNLQRIFPKLKEWTKDPGQGYIVFSGMERAVIDQFSRYMGHVRSYIGGIYYTDRTTDQPGPVYECAPRIKQKEAVDFLQKQLFTTPSWLIDEKYWALTGYGGSALIMDLQTKTLMSIMSNYHLSYFKYSEEFSPKDAYKLSEFLSDMKSGIWSELKEHKPIDRYRRNLQRNYVDRLITTMDLNQNVFERIYADPRTDVWPQIRGQIRNLILEIKSSIPYYKKDSDSRLHLEYVRDRLEEKLEPKTANGAISTPSKTTINSIEEKNDSQIDTYPVGCWEE